VLVARILSHF